MRTLSLGLRGRVVALAVMPVTIIGMLLLSQLISGKIDDLDQSLRVRAATIARQLAPAAEYGVASGNHGVLQTLLEKLVGEADISGVSIFAANGKHLAHVGQAIRIEAAQDRLPPVDRLHRIEYPDRLVYYAPIIRTEVTVDDFNQTHERPARLASHNSSSGLGRAGDRHARPPSGSSGNPSGKAC